MITCLSYLGADVTLELCEWVCTYMCMQITEYTCEFVWFVFAAS